MQNIKHIIVCSLLLMFGASVFAQTEDLNFTLQSSSIEMDGDSTNIESILKKEGNQFVWTQQIGENESISTYTIIDSTENWDIDNSTGTIEYTLEINGYQNTLSISGDSNGVSVALSSATSNGQIETLVFNISTVSYN